MLRTLEGIRIVDLSQNLAGPYCTQILADLGASVIKVEPPGGDPARDWGPPFRDGQSTLFLSTNGNKRSIVVDLKHASGRAVAERLLEHADVVVQSFRAGVADRLGVGADAVRAAHPRVVYCSVSAYGERGPLRALPGYDPLLQARGGLISVTGQPGQPARVGTSLVDMGTGMWAAIGILAALREREQTGQGCHVATSLYDTVLAWMSYHLLGWAATGVVPGPLGTAFPSIAPYDAFPAADGALMIAAANDGLFRRLCAALGLDDLAEDPRFRDNASRVAHRDQLDARIAAATASQPRERLERTLNDAGVPCAPILDAAEVAVDPQTRSSGMIRQGSTGQTDIGLPLEWDGMRAPPRDAPPLPGGHTREILAEAGYDAAERDALLRSGAVAEAAPSTPAHRDGPDRGPPLRGRR